MDFSKLYECFIILFYKHVINDNNQLNKEEYDFNYIYKYAYNFWKEYNSKKLNLSKEEDKEKLFQFLNDTFRYVLLNDCIKKLYLNITDNLKDEFLINNFDKITNITKNIINNNEVFDYNDSSIPSLSCEELDEYFKELLITIDDSKEYLKTYESLKKENKLLFIDLLDEEAKKEFKRKLNISNKISNNFVFKTKDNDYYLVLDRKGDISDLRSLIHEFIHYYIMVSNSNEPYYLLDEFPSMFYEYIANKFLLTKGYNEEDINKLYLYRFKEISNKSSHLISVNYYLELFYRNSFNITHEDDMEKIKETITNFIEKYGIEEYKKKLEKNKNLNNYDKTANLSCDIANLYLVSDMYNLVLNYPYLIGHYLSLHYVEELSDNKINLKDMKKITKNLSNIDPNIILEIDKKKKSLKK